MKHDSLLQSNWLDPAASQIFWSFIGKKGPITNKTPLLPLFVFPVGKEGKGGETWRFWQQHGFFFPHTWRKKSCEKSKEKEEKNWRLLHTGAH